MGAWPSARGDCANNRSGVAVLCRKSCAVLLIARLERLARNVTFISALMENGTDFISCDMPQASRLTIHILAAVAEHEREMISKRTKAAPAEAKRRGTKLGNPRIEEATGARAGSPPRQQTRAGGIHPHTGMAAEGMDAPPHSR